MFTAEAPPRRAILTRCSSQLLIQPEQFMENPMSEYVSIETFTVHVTPFQQNCTGVVCKKTGKCAIIDPGGDVPLIMSEVNRRGLTVEKIWVTHGHLDHGGGAKSLKDETGAIIEGPHDADAFLARTITQDALRFGMDGMHSFESDRWLKDGDIVTIGEAKWDVIHCPGHTPGHVVYYNKENNLAFVGDVLFRNSIGRTDLPRSNPADLIHSITQKLWPLGDVEFVPGHGGKSSFGKERANNPFVSDKIVASL